MFRAAARVGLRSRVGGSSITYGLRPTARYIVTQRYTTDHEMLSYDDSTSIGTVHITNYAQSSLGDVVFIELPKTGTVVKKGDQIGAVESVKAASDIYAPVSGKIEEVNTALDDQASLLNKSPEADGWLCKIKLSNPAEVERLLSVDAYAELCES